MITVLFTKKGLRASKFIGFERKDIDDMLRTANNVLEINEKEDFGIFRIYKSKKDNLIVNTIKNFESEICLNWLLCFLWFHLWLINPSR